MAEDDPSVIRSLAVSPQDAVDAYIYSRENPGAAVLRVTPPFHGRMRARLHVYRVDDTELTGAVHVSPAAVIDDEVTADYPVFEEAIVDDTDATVRSRERHAEAVTAWQDRARESIVDAVTIELADGTHRVEIKRVG